MLDVSQPDFPTDSGASNVSSSDAVAPDGAWPTDVDLDAWSTPHDPATRPLSASCISPCATEGSQNKQAATQVREAGGQGQHPG